MKLDRNYWNERYRKGETGWDIGTPSPALMDYALHLPDKTARILIPGCGNAYEGDALRRDGFPHVFLLDISPLAMENVRKNFPDFPVTHLIEEDFFLHEGVYDVILEQTFFCALDPSLRHRYAAKMASLLTTRGRLAGLLFASPFAVEGPPFGGSSEEYMKVLSPYFDVTHMAISDKSIAPRMGNELFFEAIKKDNPTPGKIA
ncbi:MAG: SAM-dependent methyltransferase [Flavobacteriales bacterium]|nr:SAM-dependent methyltransferase [Flavobacteriales bacterium]MCB9449463.1 SAM-dependent methyltransferase [Flavobacteriales bacterium]